MPEPTSDQSVAFISYCHTDKAIAIAVQEALEARGWFAFRDETDVEPGAPLPSTLGEAIDRADLFIAIVSADYVASAPCMWELDRAVARKFGDDPLRVVPLRAGDVAMPPVLAAEVYVKVAPGEETSVVEHVLGDRRLTEQRESAARPSPSPEPPDAPAGEPSQHELVREAVRYARELDTIAKIDHALVDIQRTIESAARSYDEDAYRDAYEKWQEVWARHTSPVSDPELLDRIQVVGSLLSEVVLSDRTPHQLRPWMVVARGHERPCRTRLHDAR